MSVWPESLSSIGILRTRPAAIAAHCQYAGCKGVELRVYVGVKKELFPICFEHAIRWSKWDGGNR